jgi:hypothetical protein
MIKLKLRIPTAHNKRNATQQRHGAKTSRMYLFNDLNMLFSMSKIYYRENGSAVRPFFVPERCEKSQNTGTH